MEGRRDREGGRRARSILPKRGTRSFFGRKGEGGGERKTERLPTPMSPPPPGGIKTDPLFPNPEGAKVTDGFNSDSERDLRIVSRTVAAVFAEL